MCYARSLPCKQRWCEKLWLFEKRFLEQKGGLRKTFEIIINEAKRKKNFNAYFQTTIALTLTLVVSALTRSKLADNCNRFRRANLRTIAIDFAQQTYR